MVTPSDPKPPVTSNPTQARSVSPYPEVVNAQRNGSEIKLKHCFVWDDAMENLGIDCNVPRFVQWYFEHRNKTQPNEVLLGLAKRVHKGTVYFLQAEDWASLYYLGCVRAIPDTLALIYSGPEPVRPYQSDLNDIL